MDGERTMNCEDVRIRLLDYQRGRLPLPAQGEMRAHLDVCPDCTRADTVEQTLTSVLEHHLPQHPASLALKRRLAAQWPAAGAEPSRWSRWRPQLTAALAVAALVLVATPVMYYERAASRLASERAGMVGEAVNDHLRLLSSRRPLDVESGDHHQVKPWFAGRLDFAPVVPFEGDADFPLKGGAIGYFRDRKAAVFVYARRLHPISLLVFPADGLVWPAHDLTRIGSVDAYATSERGFNVILWQRRGLGYALVSDVDARELKQLATKMTGP
jgi:anti-sigma factor RsiW